MGELRPYVRLLRGHRARLALGTLLLTLTTFAAIGLLGLSGWFITASGVTAALWAAGTMVAFDVFVPGAGIRSFALTRTVARYGERIQSHDAVLRLLADLRVAVFAQLARLDAATLGRFRSATLLNRLTADVDDLDTLYLRALGPPLVALLAIAGVTALVAVFSVPLALVAGGALTALWLLLVVAGWRGGHGLAAHINRETEALRVRVIEQVDGLAELLAFGSLARRRAACETTGAGLAALHRRLGIRTAAADALATAGVQATSALVLVGGALLFREGTLSMPVVVLLALAVLGTGELVGMLPAAFLHLGRARSAARRLNAQMALAPWVRDPTEPTRMPARSELRLAAVTVRHARWQPPALDALDFSLGEGQCVLVSGVSGSGKSTLADTVARLVDPESGWVTLGGVPLPELSLADLRQRVAYLTQRTDLYADTVAANLRVADPAAGDEALWRALAVAGLDDVVAGLPKRLECRLGPSGTGLSGGEARRLALARVVLRDAPLVVLDEPFAGLDEATAGRVAARLEVWLQGRSALLLAHDGSAMPSADRRLRLSHGRLEDEPEAARGRR